MKLGLEGKIAIVTGAGSGIGAAVSRQLGGEGAEVIVADRDADAARSVAAEIRSAGGRARDFTVDVTDAGAVEQMVAFTVRECGGLHLAVNNAGIEGPRQATADYPLEDWRRLIEVNLNGVFYCMKYEIAAMLGKGGGAIVNMSSILGAVALPTASAYTAAKHGVVGLTKAAGIEYARMGIRINAVGPAGSKRRFCRDIRNWRRHDAWKRCSRSAGGKTGGSRGSRLFPAVGTGELHHRQLSSGRRGFTAH